MYDVRKLHVGVNRRIRMYTHVCVSARTHNQYSQVLGVGLKASKFIKDITYLSNGKIRVKLNRLKNLTPFKIKDGSIRTS
jgi:hypothetical protein